MQMGAFDLRQLQRYTFAMERLGFLRAIDRTVLGTVGLLVLLNGIYLSGPWYLPADPNGSPAPLYYLLNEHVWISGVLHIIFGAGIIVNLVWEPFASLLHWMILGAFLVRLYSLMGVYNVSPLLPPGYLSHTVTVVLLGAYWLYVRYARY